MYFSECLCIPWSCCSGFAIVIIDILLIFFFRVFIKEIVGTTQIVLLWAVVTAWSLWAASIASVVLSYFFSRAALRKAIEQSDKDDFSGGVGGCAAKVTQLLNWFSGILFILGIIFLIVFSANNIGEKL